MLFGIAIDSILKWLFSFPRWFRSWDEWLMVGRGKRNSAIGCQSIRISDILVRFDFFSIIYSIK